MKSMYNNVYRSLMGIEIRVIFLESNLIIYIKSL